MSDQLQVRVHGDGSLPTLVYLPGLHGNWMLVGGFRRMLAGRLRFVEIAYPPTLTWTLVDHAAAIEAGLAERGITRGWLLAESFGSQVLWPILARKRFQAEGVILAGGFVRHPFQRAVRVVEKLCGGLSFALLARVLLIYANLIRFRFRDSPETLVAIREYIAGVTELDRQAGRHRLQLVARNDPRATVRAATLPVYALSGLIDPIVPWVFSRFSLKRNCPGLRAFKIIWHSDHNVLGTASRAAAEQIVDWITREQGLHAGQGTAGA